MTKEMKKLSYWIDHTADETARCGFIHQYKELQKVIRTLPVKPADNKKFTFVRYADDWLPGVCGTKQECEELKAEISEFLSTELKLTLSEEKTLITHSSEKVHFLGYDFCVRRSQVVKGYKMQNGKWRKSRSLNGKVALTVPHSEKIESFLFAKGVIRQKPNGEFQPIFHCPLDGIAVYTKAAGIFIPGTEKCPELWDIGQEPKTNRLFNAVKRRYIRFIQMRFNN